MNWGLILLCMSVDSAVMKRPMWNLERKLVSLVAGWVPGHGIPVRWK